MLEHSIIIFHYYCKHILCTFILHIARDENAVVFYFTTYCYCVHIKKSCKLCFCSTGCVVIDVDIISRVCFHLPTIHKRILSFCRQSCYHYSQINMFWQAICFLGLDPIFSGQFSSSSCGHLHAEGWAFSRKHASLPLQLWERETEAAGATPHSPHPTNPITPSSRTCLIGRSWQGVAFSHSTPHPHSSFLVGWHPRGSDLTRSVPFLQRPSHQHYAPLADFCWKTSLISWTSGNQQSSLSVFFFFFFDVSEQKNISGTDLCTLLFFF